MRTESSCSAEQECLMNKS